MANQITEEHLAQSHSAVSDTIITLVMTFAPAVLASVIADQSKFKKARKVLTTMRDMLNAALPA
jgi:hypothetical protein